MYFVHLASSGTQKWAWQVKERHQGAVAEGAKENGMQLVLLGIYIIPYNLAEGMLSVPENAVFPLNIAVVDMLILLEFNL